MMICWLAAPLTAYAMLTVVFVAAAGQFTDAGTRSDSILAVPEAGAVVDEVVEDAFSPELLHALTPNAETSTIADANALALTRDPPGPAADAADASRSRTRSILHLV